MKITALDIRQKTFEKSFRGIDKDEVQAFLNTISQQWERMGEENRELRFKLDHAQQDVQKLREVESSLYRTLKTAEDTGNSITEQAQRDADLRRREAQLQAEHTLADARQRARAIVDEAYQTAAATVADMQKEVSGLGQECQRLEQQLDTLVHSLHHLASEALDRAQRAGARPKNGAAAILSRAASVQVAQPTAAAAPEPASPPAAAAPKPASPPAMHPSASAAHPAAALSAARAANAPAVRAEAPTAFAPAAYNPKPGQQPDPRNPDQAPGPDIERPQAPRENPGISPAPFVPEPGPETVPNSPSPYVEPTRPEITPIGPDRPDIQQPEPMTHPGMAAAPAGEKSFFDEI